MGVDIAFWCGVRFHMRIMIRSDVGGMFWLELGVLSILCITVPRHLSVSELERNFCLEYKSVVG